MNLMNYSWVYGKIILERMVRMEFEKIKPIKTCCLTIGNLPTSYLESMTYLEQVMWLSKFINDQIIPALNNNTELVEQLKKSIDDIDINFENLNNRIDKILLDVNNEIEQQNMYVAEQLRIYNNAVLSMMNQFQTLITNDLNNKVDNLQSQIDDIQIGDIFAYNPTSGQLENINKVLNDIYDSVRYDAITVDEFELLDLTATEFDEKHVTAYQFDNNGKTVLTN